MALFAPPPHRVPVLTEVIDVPRPEPVPMPPASAWLEETAQPEVDPLEDGTTLPAFAAEGAEVIEAAAALAPPLPLSLLDADTLTEHVLSDVQRQVDLVLEQRLRERLAPALARLTDALVREVRSELGTTLHDIVQRAVAIELARHRRPDEP
jgi:hypothetical protein